MKVVSNRATVVLYSTKIMLRTVHLWNSRKARRKASFSKSVTRVLSSIIFLLVITILMLIIIMLNIIENLITWLRNYLNFRNSLESRIVCKDSKKIIKITANTSPNPTI